MNQEKLVDTIFKVLFNSNGKSKGMLKFKKPVGTRPDTIYGLCNHINGDVPPFRPVLSGLQTPTYNLAKF